MRRGPTSRLGTPTTARYNRSMRCANERCKLPATGWSTAEDCAVVACDLHGEHFIAIGATFRRFKRPPPLERSDVDG